jgi:hypothetical protein
LTLSGQYDKKMVVEYGLYPCPPEEGEFFSFKEEG